MRKLLVMTLCGLAAVGANAQKATVDAAKKLAGKTDKIEEARALIQDALQNPETANEATTYYVAGKIEWDAYDKNRQAQAINPDKVNTQDMGNELLNGYNYFVQVFPLDQVPNEKGEVKPKYIKELQKKIAEKDNDFFEAGANFFNDKLYYPQAYNAFMIYGDMPAMEILGPQAPVVADTIRATAYFNAGLAAWSANEVDEAAKAFMKACENNYTQPDAYIYEIACWQNIEQNDSSRLDDAKVNILKAAKAGYDKFGMQQPVFLNNMVNSMLNSNQEAEALNIVNNAMSDNPDTPALYGLRGFVYERLGNDDAAEADYRAAAEMPEVDFDTLRNAIRKIFRNGQEKWNDIELGDTESREKKHALKENYFNVAKKYAEKAAQLQPGDPDIEYLMEAIDYQLSL